MTTVFEMLANDCTAWPRPCPQTVTSHSQSQMTASIVHMHASMRFEELRTVGRVGHAGNVLMQRRARLVSVSVRYRRADELSPTNRSFEQCRPVMGEGGGETGWVGGGGGGGRGEGVERGEESGDADWTEGVFVQMRNLVHSQGRMNHFVMGGGG